MLDLFSITVILARFFALYMLVNATFSIPSVLAVIKQTTEIGFGIGADSIITITTLAYVIVALLILISAKRFASYVTRGLDNSVVQISEDNLRVLQAVAFSILGAYVLTYAIPNLVKMVTLYLIPDTPTSDDISYAPAQWRVPIEYVVQAVAQMALGIWLLVGSRGIVRVVKRGWDNIKAE